MQPVSFVPKFSHPIWKFKVKIVTTSLLLLREDFVQFAKSSKAVKSLVEKETKVSMKEMGRKKSQGKLKIDKALSAFKV